MRLINPTAARITAVKNDLLDPPALLLRMFGQRHGIAKFLEQDGHYPLEFAPLMRG